MVTEGRVRSLVRAASVRWTAWRYLRCRVCRTRRDFVPGVGLCRDDLTAPARNDR